MRTSSIANALSANPTIQILLLIILGRLFLAELLPLATSVHLLPVLITTLFPPFSSFQCAERIEMTRTMWLIAAQHQSLPTMP